MKRRQPEDEVEMVIEEQVLSSSRRKTKTTSKPLSVVEKIRSKIKIDPSRPTYDLLVFWKALDWNLEEIEKKETIKWQPDEKDAASWDSLELELVNADLRQEEGKRKVFCPKTPWKYANEFLDFFSISEDEFEIISRIEIVAAENVCTLVVADKDSYLNESRIQMRWIITDADNLLTEAGDPLSELDKKIDLRKTGLDDSSKTDPRLKKHLKYIKSRSFLMKNGVFSDEDVMSFATESLQRACQREFPLIESLELERISKKDDDSIPF